MPEPRADLGRDDLQEFEEVIIRPSPSSGGAGSPVRVVAPAPAPSGGILGFLSRLLGDTEADRTERNYRVVTGAGSEEPEIMAQLTDDQFVGLVGNAAGSLLPAFPQVIITPNLSLSQGTKFTGPTKLRGSTSPKPAPIRRAPVIPRRVKPIRKPSRRTRPRSPPKPIPRQPPAPVTIPELEPIIITPPKPRETPLVRPRDPSQPQRSPGDRSAPAPRINPRVVPNAPGDPALTPGTFAPPGEPSSPALTVPLSPFTQSPADGLGQVGADPLRAIRPSPTPQRLPAFDLGIKPFPLPRLNPGTSRTPLLDFFSGFDYRPAIPSRRNVKDPNNAPEQIRGHLDPLPDIGPVPKEELAHDCQCAKPKKKKKKGTEREVCMQGTYTQRKKGIKYAPKRAVPCEGEIQEERKTTKRKKPKRPKPGQLPGLSLLN